MIKDRTGRHGAPGIGERRDSRQTRATILKIAERLFAEAGIDRVSLRRIAVEAGQANSSAVQYHFADKDGLVCGIIRKRALEFEQERARAMSALMASGGEPDARRLHDICLRPLSRKGDAGVFAYASLLHQIMAADRYDKYHPLVVEVAPITMYIAGLLQEAVGMPAAIFRYRMQQSTLCYLNALMSPPVGSFGDGSPYPDWETKVDVALLAAHAVLLSSPDASASARVTTTGVLSSPVDFKMPTTRMTDA
ncbi:helix-turn-helix domain-containing protein [Croceicoccus sp. BE223]|uniref:TetR/AcrR family transcriptional regulator n=1 Tax=Croceicoccus sp. BE223 TaxID=2817716 RepID=UPI00285C4CFA|nr:helix-turn-helix domain-containing protein [Croceicoccus sp. BE223]MDR7103728.1 AcrR family transcriptional regulator [Croceicoccus sp. BE223]